MRRLVWAWVAGTVTYVAVLVGGAVLVGVLTARSGEVVTAWPLLVVPGVVAGAVAVLVATARAVVRPPRRRGLVAVSLPALVAFGMSVASSLEAASRADVPPLVHAVDVAVPVIVLLATGGAGGLLAHVRWTPASRSSYAEVV
ncbi:hypothetical protein J1G42_07175 [Cellulomonas sp. zg-ZUI222]|uniref:Uncharacterized protein n=1 Tax=Cellulomonas wangleii TaxID=2816956 RepID=A0ABX8D5P3_9CELL|nr:MULTISPECIES: hypothetical protein [Cellulomonas]MBO0899743.1 hypothetical protein [Cellulomonas sp. zg-ZUI22]MBO0920605.1 hypothetical protein [Cellulomonas wangleii]MBO0922977.1 hypothetical protein [Cellulomonas wangleii]QVI61367.1 hypothetical protein KG103_12865 [Cellulomonas wangleii]